jgi:membrane-bound metal-dependent hydrolase YbcI (DUF457 family)
LRIWRRWQDAPFKRFFYFDDRISIASAIVGAFLGTYSHVFLDSIMHADVEPFRPFSAQNPSYNLINWIALHAFCLVLAAVGTFFLSASKHAR